MANTEVGSAYISVWPEMSNFTKEVSKTINGMDGAIKTATDKMSNTMLSGFNNTFAQVAMAGTGAISAIGGAMAALAVGGGISRALTIDDAKFKLKVLGLDVQNVMANATAAVDETAYSLASAATSAAILGSSGVAAGESMTNALKGVVGAATVSGDSMENIAQIFAKVSARGKLSGEELMQFSARGVNALKVLGDYMNKSQEEVRKMVTEGKIDFQTFSAAFEEFGKKAKDANDTISGSASNVRSAFSRIGQIFMEPVFSHIVQIFNSLIPALKATQKALEPVAKAFNGFLDMITPSVIDLIGKFTDYMNSLGEKGLLGASKGVQALAAALALMSAGGIASAMGALPVIGGMFAGLAGPIAALANPIGLVSAAFAGIAKVAGTIKTAFTGISAVIGNVGAGFSLLGEAFTSGTTISMAFANGMKAIPAVIGSLVSPIGIAVAAVAAIAGAFVYAYNTSEEFRSFIGEAISFMLPLFSMLGNALSELGSTILPILQGAFASVGGLLMELATAAIPVLEVGIQLLVALFSSVVVVLTGVITAVTWFINALMNLPATIEEMCVAGMELFANFEASVIGFFTGLTDGVVSGVSGMADNAAALFDWLCTTASDFVSSMVSAVTGFFSNLASSVVSTVSGFVNSVVNFFTNLVSSASSQAQNLVSRVAGIIGGLPGMAAAWGSDLIGNFVNGIMSRIGDVVGAVSNIAGTVRSFLHFTEPDVGPLSDFHTYMPDMMRLMAQGIRNNIGLIRNEVDNVAGVMSDGFAVSSPSFSPSNGSYNFNGITINAQDRSMDEVFNEIVSYANRSRVMMGVR